MSFFSFLLFGKGVINDVERLTKEENVCYL
jgi:hypothetical protein